MARLCRALPWPSGKVYKKSSPGAESKRCPFLSHSFAQRTIEIQFQEPFDGSAYRRAKSEDARAGQKKRMKQYTPNQNTTLAGSFGGT